jgi:hypothetical protein
MRCRLVRTVLPAHILKCCEIAACDDIHHRLLRCAWILGKRLRAAALRRASATKLRTATLIDQRLRALIGLRRAIRECSNQQRA